MDTLYAAYGSNLSHAQMRLRCPGARPVEGLILPGWQLLVRRFADIAPHAASDCPIGLWQVSRHHVAALDRHEGHPFAYRRQALALPDGRTAIVYLERDHRPGPPRDDYVARLRAGYRDFGFDLTYLEAALRRPAATRP